MLIHYLLIYLLVDRNTLVSAPPAAVFDDKPACEAAIDAISDMWRGNPLGQAYMTHASAGICVAQSTPAPPVVGDAQ